jgi:hypothetical protein
MPSARFCRYGRFGEMRAAVRASGLRVGYSPLGATPGECRRQEGGQFFLANQNLQHLVLKCLLRTKDSRVANAWQALFDAQEDPPETTTKTAHCGSVCHIFTHVPPSIHRLVHRIGSRRTVGRTLQFYDSTKRTLVMRRARRKSAHGSVERWRREPSFHAIAPVPWAPRRWPACSEWRARAGELDHAPPFLDGSTDGRLKAAWLSISAAPACNSRMDSAGGFGCPAVGPEAEIPGFVCNPLPPSGFGATFDAPTPR